MESEIKNHCEKEGKKSLQEVSVTYRRRLENVISREVREPYCWPCCKPTNCSVVEWINMSDYRKSEGFTFYHHSKESVLDYAISNRSNYNTHLYSMDRLYFDEYPSPLGEGKVYLVSTNGNHRSVVFSCIGFKKVKANICKISNNSWLYYVKDNYYDVYKILLWLKSIDLISEFKLIEDRLYQIEGIRNIAGWILPDPSIGGVFKLFDDMQNRYMKLEKSFPEINLDKFSIIKSKNKKILSFYLFQIKRYVLNFLELFKG